ncbi:putative Glycosyl transferase, family 2 [Candidatus Sulfobium mesophilum]|uniref:Putative Glycosyl transferase, family 2 n=1 Tax=Candidatus Sulfobium mesophilum TaxID=2016548 RepID=A0A2U3QDK7_9BACT|nr:putative Glycosyl transferase, family 2 [Candidatus Sulfobium mesophilum]
MLVSVVIPAYNSEAFLEKTLQSVFSQTFRDFEVICIDDGSTDSTPQVIRKHGQSVRYVYQTNRGAAVARNRGIGMARGEFLAFLDADDRWLPDKLARQVRYLQENRDVAMVHSNVCVIDSRDSITKPCLPISERHRGFQIFTELYLGNFIATPSSVMVRRSCLDAVGNFDETMRCCEDFDLWLRIAANCKIGYQDVVMVKYRMHETNVSNDKMAMNITVKRVIDGIKVKYPEKVSSIPTEKMRKRVFDLNRWIGLGYFRQYDLASARKHFLGALKCRRTSIPLYIYLLSTFFGKDIIGMIRNVKKRRNSHRKGTVELA